MKSFLFAALLAGSIAHADKIQLSCQDFNQGQKVGSETIYDVQLQVGPLGEAVGVWLGTLERKALEQYKQTITIGQIRGSSTLWSHYLDTTLEVNGAKISTKGEYVISLQYENEKTKEAFRTECSLNVPKGVASLCNAM